MPYTWEPAVSDVTPHLYARLSGGATQDDTDAITAWIAKAVGHVYAQVGAVPSALDDMANDAAALWAAYSYERSHFPEQYEDGIAQLLRDDAEAALTRLEVAISKTSPETARRTYGSPRMGNDYVRDHLTYNL